MKALKPSQRCGMPVSCVDVSRDGTRYLWGGGSPGEDCSVSICDTATNKVLHVLKGHKKPVLHARFLEDGSVVSFSFDSHVCRWTADGELAASNETRLSHRADGFAVASNGKLAVSGDYRGELTGWQLKDGSKAWAFPENTEGQQIWSVAIAADNKCFVSGGAGGKIRLWNLAKKREDACIDLGIGYHIYGLDWLPDSQRFAAAVAPDGRAEKGTCSRVIVFESDREVMAFATDGHQPRCCRFSADGRLLAAAGGGTDRGGGESKSNCVIHVWNVATGKEVATLAGHTNLVRDLAFSPDSKWLLSAGWDQTLRAWPLS